MPSWEFSFCFFISYALICTCIRRHLKETIPSSSITWSEMGKQNVQAEKVYSVGPEILVLSEDWDQYCRTDTTREWLDTTCTTRTTRTGRETLVYGLYRSWINGDMHIISNTALQPQWYDPYESYDSYGS